jgi:hypothetical protein
MSAVRDRAPRRRRTLPYERSGISALDLENPVLVAICATALRERLLTLRRTEPAKLDGDGRSVD